MLACLSVSCVTSCVKLLSLSPSQHKTSMGRINHFWVRLLPPPFKLPVSGYFITAIGSTLRYHWTHNLVMSGFLHLSSGSMGTTEFVASHDELVEPAGEGMGKIPASVFARSSHNPLSSLKIGLG